MKNQKFKVAALAMILGISGAVASSHKAAFTNHKWSLNASGVYTDITGQKQGTNYFCDESTNTCTATYPAGQDPNVNPASPISVELGDLR